MAEFNNNIHTKLNARDYSLDTSVGLYQTDPIIDVQRGSMSLGETFTTRDLWEGDIKSIPYEPSCEEATMEELDEHIGQQITIKKSDGPVVVKVVSRWEKAYSIAIRYTSL